jgi:hypothetical protein
MDLDWIWGDGWMFGWLGSDWIRYHDIFRSEDGRANI